MPKYLTKEGLEKLNKEMEYLTKVKRKEVAEKLKDAIAQGDLKENAGYDAAKNEQGFIEARIKEIRGIVSQAEIIDNGKSDKVQIGSVVVLSSDDGQDKFQLVSPEEADIMSNKISHQSPLGEALCGKRKGTRIKVSTPGGKIEYKILEIN